MVRTVKVPFFFLHTVVWTQFIEILSFSHWIAFVPFLIISWQKNWVYFRTLYFVPLITGLFLKKYFIYILLERGEWREKERERNIDVWEKHILVVSHTPPVGDLAHNPGRYLVLESNWRPLGSQAGAASTEPHQPRQITTLEMVVRGLQLWYIKSSAFSYKL